VKRAFSVIALGFVLAGLVACDKDKPVRPPLGGGSGGGGQGGGTAPGAGPAPIAPPTDSVPAEPTPPKDTDVTCTGLYGNEPYHLIFKANGTCWFQDTHGPDVCRFTMDKKKIQLNVGTNGIGGRFEDDCSAVWFGGQSWKKTGPVPTGK